MRGETKPLNDGHSIPTRGFGTWRIDPSDTERAVRDALDVGYRLIDTAALYENERETGWAVKTSSIPRADIFVTTKLANGDQGHDKALRAFDKSYERLGLDYIDLYLIHWPVPAQDLYLETWKALMRLKSEGRVRSIGVSNFNISHLERILGETGDVPVLNQIELHPLFSQENMRQFHERHAILTEAWRPLGRGAVLEHPVVQRIARKYECTEAQIILEWHRKLGLVAIPKTVSKQRMIENFSTLNVEIDQKDMEVLSSLSRLDGRLGGDPETFS